MEFKDRIANYPNRWIMKKYLSDNKTIDSSQVAQYLNLERADGVTSGTLLNAQTMNTLAKGTTKFYVNSGDKLDTFNFDWNKGATIIINVCDSGGGYLEVRRISDNSVITALVATPSWHNVLIIGFQNGIRFTKIEGSSISQFHDWGQNNKGIYLYGTQRNISFMLTVLES